MTIRLLALAAIMCTLVSAAPAQANPYRGEITVADVPVPIGADGVADGGTSRVSFEGAGSTHTVGRVSIRIVPLLSGLEENVKIDGNLRSSGSGHTVRYETYRDLIKESITLKSPETVRYSYDLALSDWVTTETDESRPVEIRDANSTVIVTYPYTNPVIKYAKDSTIDINPDQWGNLIVDVNGEDVVVMSRPVAVDAAGKSFDLDFELDKKAKTIAITGDLEGAGYPLVIDPTQRVTNGGFETGTTSGWETVVGDTVYYTVKSDDPYKGTYYLDIIGTGGYSGLRQGTVNYTGVSRVSQAVKILEYNQFDIVFSHEWYNYGNWFINWPAQTPHTWSVRSTTPTLSGISTYDIWTYSTTHGHVDSVYAFVPDAPVASFSGSPGSGYAQLTVRFTDSSTNAPTSWLWDFGDGDSTNATAKNPVHTYTSAGTYTVSLTATNSGGSDSEEKEDYITVETPTYSMTNIEDYLLPSLDLSNASLNYYPGTDIYSNLSSELQNDGWQEGFYHHDSAVVREDFGPEDEGLVDSTFHYHFGHGNERHEIILYNYLPPTHNPPPTTNEAVNISEVVQKWNNPHKWILIDACSILGDDSWSQALGTSHAILGFSSEKMISQDLLTLFLHYTLDEDRSIFTAYRNATYDSFTENVTAAVIFDNYSQFQNDHFPGHGMIEPDEYPETSANDYYLPWGCGGGPTEDKYYYS